MGDGAKAICSGCSPCEVGSAEISGDFLVPLKREVTCTELVDLYQIAEPFSRFVFRVDKNPSTNSGWLIFRDRGPVLNRALLAMLKANCASKVKEDICTEAEAMVKFHAAKEEPILPEWVTTGAAGGAGLVSLYFIFVIAPHHHAQWETAARKWASSKFRKRPPSGGASPTGSGSSTNADSSSSRGCSGSPAASKSRLDQAAVFIGTAATLLLGAWLTRLGLTPQTLPATGVPLSIGGKVDNEG